MKQRLYSLWVLGLTMLIAFDATGQNHREQERNEGYSLLYEVVSKQSDLSKILLVKGVGTNTTALVNDISDSAARIQKQLDAFAKEDKNLRVREKVLPTLEVQTRDAIAVTTTKELVLSRGREFEVNLLLTQVYALRYGAQLAKQLQELEDNKERRECLGQMAKQWEELRRRVIKEAAPTDR